MPIAIANPRKFFFIPPIAPTKSQPGVPRKTNSAKKAPNQYIQNGDMGKLARPTTRNIATFDT